MTKHKENCEKNPENMKPGNIVLYPCTCQELSSNEPLKNIKPHTTHHACEERLAEYRGKTVGCCCVGHDCQNPSVDEATKFIHKHYSKTFGIMEGFEKDLSDLLKSERENFKKELIERIRKDKIIQGLKKVHLYIIINDIK